MMKKNFGMWIFLATEIVIFGTMILLYQIFYYRYRTEFRHAAHDLHFFWGSLNTVILLTSSALVAWVQEKKNRKGLIGAIILGFVFLMIKGHEYLSLTEEGKFPLHFKEGLAQTDRLFYTFYGYLTFLHAIHVILGIMALSYLFHIYRRHNGSDRVEEGVGLYWHFVDIVWVFLYPLFYLAGRG
jgi:cytochrome c oxidase subunit 3